MHGAILVSVVANLQHDRHKIILESIDVQSRSDLILS